MVSRPRRVGLVNRLRRHRLAAFFVLTFALSWGVAGAALVAADALPFAVSFAGRAPLAYLVVWAPALAALGVVGVTEGRVGLARFLRRAVTPAGRWPWYVAVLAGVPAVYLASAVVGAVTGGPPLAFEPGWLPAFVTVALLRVLQGPIEELGWRGFALPLLQRRHSGLVSAVLLGLVWALWHTPALVVSTAEFARGGALLPAVGRLFATLVATSVVVTVVFNGSGGSVPLAVLFHWLTNLAYPWETTTVVPVAQDALVVVVAAVVAATVGRRYLGHEHLATDVMAGADGSTAAAHHPSTPE
jgi:hypothetical protein